LSLVALLAAGGIAFDYARLAALDTELQNAADQATLAAASQLDKKTGVCERAVAAAQNLVTNQTIFANDNKSIAVRIGPQTNPPQTATQLAGCNASSDAIATNATKPIRFYQDAAKTTFATTDQNAKFVEITVNSRTANYILTPIVSAISGTISAKAFAGIGSAICKVPPLMMCNPVPGTAFNADNYPTDPTPGWKGVGLRVFQGGTNTWGPGAFGWVDVGATNNGSPDQNIAIGMDTPNTNCVADANVNVDTGASTSVLDALNVRFDMFTGSFGSNTCFGSTGCNPAYNSTKDVVRRAVVSQASCDYKTNTQAWYLPSTAAQYIAQDNLGNDSTIDFMGYPMDWCHYPNGGVCRTVATGSVDQRFGNAKWRRDLYFLKNHGNVSDATGSNWQTITGWGANATRYDFYKWEQNRAGNNSGTLPPDKTIGSDKQYGRAICKPPGLTPGGTTPDRRVVAAAVADNCAALRGGSRALTVTKWVELFLVQPSIARGSGPSQVTANNEIYVEVIGSTNPTGSGATAQVVTREIPYLLE
jgi:hypothetical protein